MTTKRTTINGCPAVWLNDRIAMINHPIGYMLYVGGWRVGVYQTKRGLLRRANREMAEVTTR